MGHYRRQTPPSIVKSMVLIAALVMMARSASAATDIQGGIEDLKLRAENASLREVLNALSVKFKLTYKLPGGIERSMSGLYSGTLKQVLERILDGNDYIVEVSNTGSSVVVLRSSAPSTRTVAMPIQSSSTDNSGITVTQPAQGAAQQVAETPASGSNSIPPLASYLSLNNAPP